MSDETPQVHVNCHLTLDIPEIAEGLLFTQFSPPNISVPHTEFPTFAGNGLPVNSITGGKKFQWGTASFARGVDPDGKIMTWLNQFKDEGITKDTKKTVIAHVMDESGQSILQTWTFHGAVIADYNVSAINAASNEVLTETMTLRFDDAELTPGG
jgi:phage tail-like protein